MSFHVKTDGSTTIRLAASGAGGLAELFLMRDRTAWSGHSSELTVPSLFPGETISVRRDGAAYGTLTFTGRPTPLAGACAGSTSFEVDLDPGTRLRGVDAFSPEQTDYDTIRHDAAFGWVSVFGGRSYAQFNRPLRLGETASITAEGAIPWRGDVMRAIATREFTVGPCPPAVPVDEPAPSATASLRATRTQLAKLDPSKLARKPRASLKVAVSGAGTVKLRLTTKQRKKVVTLGSGATTAKRAGTVAVSLKLTKAGRDLLRRSKRLKVTLSSTFTAAVPGAKASAQQISVTLKRPAKKRR